MRLLVHVLRKGQLVTEEVRIPRLGQTGQEIVRVQRESASRGETVIGYEVVQ
jgi:hypothetical protein